MAEMDITYYARVAIVGFLQEKLDMWWRDGHIASYEGPETSDREYRVPPVRSGRVPNGKNGEGLVSPVD